MNGHEERVTVESLIYTVADLRKTNEQLLKKVSFLRGDIFWDSLRDDYYRDCVMLDKVQDNPDTFVHRLKGHPNITFAWFKQRILEGVG